MVPLLLGPVLASGQLGRQSLVQLWQCQGSSSEPTTKWSQAKIWKGKKMILKAAEPLWPIKCIRLLWICRSKLICKAHRIYHGLAGWVSHVNWECHCTVVRKYKVMRGQKLGTRAQQRLKDTQDTDILGSPYPFTNLDNHDPNRSPAWVLAQISTSCLSANHANTDTQRISYFIWRHRRIFLRELRSILDMRRNSPRVRTKALGRSCYPPISV